MSPRKLAQRQANLLASIERDGGPLARKFSRDFERRALRAITSGGRVKLTKAEIEGIESELLDLMLLGFVKRYRSEKSALDLSLSFSREVARLARGIALDLGDLRRSFRRITGRNVRDAVASMTDSINSAISTITARQQPTRIATRELRRKLTELGITTNRPALAETLVRTHSQVAFGAAQYKLDVEQDEDDVVWGFQYVTVGDDRVRPEHAVLDGLVREKHDPIWQSIWPPNGWNCRCQVIPLTAPERQTPIPRGAAADTGFDFNPGELFAA